MDPIESPFQPRTVRAIRRHHRERLRAKRRFHWGRDLSTEPPQNIARAINTPTPCSCWMCGNPRRYFGEQSVQERRANQEDELL